MATGGWSEVGPRGFHGETVNAFVRSSYDVSEREMRNLAVEERRRLAEVEALLAEWRLCPSRSTCRGGRTGRSEHDAS